MKVMSSKMPKSVEHEYNYMVPWIVLSIIILQNPPWFMWSYAFYIMAVTVVLLLVFLSKRMVLQGHKYRRHIFILVISFLFFVLFNSAYSFRFSSLIAWFAYFLMFLVYEREKLKTVQLLTTCLSVIILISLTGWLINTYIIPLPQFGTLEMEKMGGQVITLKNHIIFLDYDNDFIKRFYGVFDEPGVLGTLTAFVLFLNRYRLREWRNLVIFIGGLFTFSMAFVVLSIIGGIIIYSKNVFSIIRILIIGLILGAIIYYFLQENVTFQKSILDRFADLSSSTERRTSNLMNQFFNDFLWSKDVFLGMGTNFISDNRHIFQGQSYQFFLIEYGIVGLCLIFWVYISMIKKVDKFSLGLLIIFFLSFVQRPFLFTPWQIVLFSVGLVYLENGSLFRRGSLQVEDGNHS